MKISAFIDEDSIKICKDKSTIVFKTEKTLTISRLLEGQFPKYNQLIPSESPKQAIVNVSQLRAALERVSVMVNDKTSIVKMHFADNELTLSADTRIQVNQKIKLISNTQQKNYLLLLIIQICS